MKITTINDQTTRTIVFHVQDGPVVESPFNSYRARQQRFQVTSGRIYMVGGEVQNVKVSGPLIKKDGSASDTVRDDAIWGASKLDELPDWLGIAREWDLQP